MVELDHGMLCSSAEDHRLQARVVRAMKLAWRGTVGHRLVTGASDTVCTQHQVVLQRSRRDVTGGMDT
jgi:hypothetical protein